MTSPDQEMNDEFSSSTLPAYRNFSLKSQQKNIEYPSLELPLGSIEINFVLAAHEAIISRFKLNKRFIEKELSQLFNLSKKMKKTCKDKEDITIENIDQLQEQLKNTKKQYINLTKIEDGLIHSLEQRLCYLKNVSKNIKDPKVLKEYFESRVSRSILDYMLINQQFDSARVLAKEANLEVFSDIELFQEIYQILEKLKGISSYIQDGGEQ